MATSFSSINNSVIQANPALLDRFVGAMQVPDLALRRSFGALLVASESFASTRNDFGSLIDTTLLATLETAVDELCYLDLWAGRIADGFRDADRLCPSGGCGAVLSASEFQLDSAGPASLEGALRSARWSNLVELDRGLAGEIQVWHLKVDRLPTDIGPVEWALIFEQIGIGPTSTVQFVIHGWGSGTAAALAAGRDFAAIYERDQVEDVKVIVLDWDGGGGFDAADLGEFSRSELKAKKTGDVLASLFDGLALAFPPLNVNVTAHSLGNVVIARALTRMSDPTGRFSVDLMMIQPAMAASISSIRSADFEALETSRVRDLSITINNDDFALGLYELGHNDSALGDEARDSADLQHLIDLRACSLLGTEIVDHDSPIGSGHLALDPTKARLVTALTQEMIDADRSSSTAQRDVRRWLYGRSSQADWLVESGPVMAYFERCRRNLKSPTVAALRRLCIESLRRRGGAPQAVKVWVEELSD